MATKRKCNSDDGNKRRVRQRVQEEQVEARRRSLRPTAARAERWDQLRRSKRPHKAQTDDEAANQQGTSAKMTPSSKFLLCLFDRDRGALTALRSPVVFLTSDEGPAANQKITGNQEGTEYMETRDLSSTSSDGDSLLAMTSSSVTTNKGKKLADSCNAEQDEAEKEAPNGVQRRVASSLRTQEGEGSATSMPTPPTLPPSLTAATPSLTGVPPEVRELIYERLPYHADRATLRRVHPRFYRELAGVPDSTICVSPYPESIEAFKAVALDPVRIAKVENIIYMDLAIRDVVELYGEFFNDLEDDEACDEAHLYEVDWRYDWLKYRKDPSTEWTLGSVARSFTNVKTLTYHSGYADSQNRQDGDERPGTDLPYDLFHVPHSSGYGHMLSLYGEKQWRCRSSGFVFTAPDGQNHDWLAVSRSQLNMLHQCLECGPSRTHPLIIHNP
jgi:hypothetical protein